MTTRATGSRPLLNERRSIDGEWHVWCGAGWIAENYSDCVNWPVEKPTDDQRLRDLSAAMAILDPKVAS